MGDRVELRAVAFCDMGIWKAVCPRPWCVKNPEWYGPGPVTGRIGGLTRTAFHCMRCGLTCPADWPDNIADIERVLAQRPFSETRNWLPGETVDDLLMENAVHGLIRPDGLPGGPLTTGGGVLTDLGRQLVSSGPPAIGGQ